MVPRIHTKVLHEEQPIKKNSYDEVLANNRLYDYTNGLINETQNQGYTAVLETVSETGGRWNRDQGNEEDLKLREVLCQQVLRVANKDKWDDAAPTYTSWRGQSATRPTGQEGNFRKTPRYRTWFGNLLLIGIWMTKCRN